MEGGGGSYAAQGPREPQRQRYAQAEEAEGDARATEGSGGGGMKFRVSARAPHGVGALLLIGGAVLAGAAVVAWRHARHRGGGKRGADGRGRCDRQQPAKQEASNGGVVEDEKSGSAAGEMDQPDDNIEGGTEETATGTNGSGNGGVTAEIQEVQDGAESRGHDLQPEKQEVSDGGGVEDGKEQETQPDDDLKGAKEENQTGSNGLDNDGVTEEIEEVHDDAEIVEDESNNKHVEEEIDLDLRRSPTEISVHDDADSEHDEKFDQSSDTELSEITTQVTDNVILEKCDENSTKNDTENDDNATKNDSENDDDSTKNETQNDEDSIMNHVENENLSNNDLKEEMTLNDNEDVEASDQCSLDISRPVIVLDKQPSLHTDYAQEAESMENSPTAQLMMHQEQLLDDMTMDTEAETAEAKLGEGTVVDKDVCKQEEQKEIPEPVGLASSPALPTLVKTTDKREPELPARIETGMKIEQDYTNGGLKEHGLIRDGGATKGAAAMTMDRRSPSMAILALMFVLTIVIAIIVRLYAPPRATKLQIDLQ